MEILGFILVVLVLVSFNYLHWREKRVIRADLRKRKQEKSSTNVLVMENCTILESSTEDILESSTEDILESSMEDKESLEVGDKVEEEYIEKKSPPVDIPDLCTQLNSSLTLWKQRMIERQASLRFEEPSQPGDPDFRSKVLKSFIKPIVDYHQIYSSKTVEKY